MHKYLNNRNPGVLDFSDFLTLMPRLAILYLGLVPTAPYCYHLCDLPTRVSRIHFFVGFLISSVIKDFNPS